MNDRGQVVGYVERNSFPRAQAFLWTPDTPNGYAGQFQLIEGMSHALGINNSGVVVGYRESPGPVATVWTAATGVRDLNDLVPAGGGVDYDVAVAINESGQIAAWGTAYMAPNFVTHGYLLSVVPEPASISLAVCGLIVVGELRRRTGS